MKKADQTKVQSQAGVAALIASAAKKDFGKTALEFITGFARVENFGAYYISDLARPVPVFSYWSGRISDYWFQRDADLILGSAETQQRIVSQMYKAQPGTVHIERWHPDKDQDARKAIYARNGIVERIAVSSKDGRSGLRSFYLRSATDGWFSDADYDGLCIALPIVHALIGLRIQIVGAAAHREDMGSNATRLREAHVPRFADLSVREAQVADLLLDGKSVTATALELAVSETTIRTLRQRAYRKLKVNSATELMALLLRTKSTL